MGSGTTEDQLRTALELRHPLDLSNTRSGPLKSEKGRTWGPARQISAASICDLLRGIGTSAAPDAVLHIIGARITGRLDLRHARITRALLVEGCYFDESIDLTGAQAPWLALLECCASAVVASGVRVDGDLDLSGLRARRVELAGARVGGRLTLNGALLGKVGQSYALNASGLSAGGGLFCNAGFVAEGGVNLYGASVGATLEFSGATLTSSDGSALRAPGLIVDADVIMSGGFSSVGVIDLFGAQMKGQIWLNGATLNSGGRRWALSAPLMRVTGGMYCRNGFQTSGSMNLFGVVIGATLEFNNATLQANGGYALRAPGLSIGLDLDFGGAKMAGAIDLSRSDIRGELLLRGADLSGSKRVDLSAATIGTICTEESQVSGGWVLKDMTYASLDPYVPATQRLRWLQPATRDYHPQPYEQLARYYRSLGQDEQARTVLLAKERHRRSRLRLPMRLWGYLQDGAVGYGYRPLRALFWLALLIALMSGYFDARHPKPSSANGPAFEPIVYSLDVLVPVLNLGQKNAFSAAGLGQWVVWSATVAGWVLATTVVAAATRAISRP